MDNPSKKNLNVLMLPWLAHGHVSPYLELAKRLTEQPNNISIHFCSTPIILESIRDHLRRHSMIKGPSSLPPPQSRINLVEIHLPKVAELPPHLQTTTNLPPHLMQTLNQAFAQSDQTFSHLLETVKPDLLIFDPSQPWVANLARQRNIPAAAFVHSTAAVCFLFQNYFAPGKELPFPALRLTQEKRGPIEDEYKQKFIESGALSFKLSDFIIARSFREIESKYIDYFSTLIGKEVVLTGPLVPDFHSVSPGDKQEAEKVLQWLDRRERRSVVYASFGSECFMSYDEMERLAHGLELSGACFIWVARFPKNHKNGEEDDMSSARVLLQGLVERVGPERGLVVTTWAPQRKIFLHRNLGCSLTHGGWSSMLEGMHAGVPMLALPMNWDQPMNAKVMVELGVGVEIRQTGLGDFKGEDVAEGIKQILGSENGASVRKNAEHWAEVLRNRKDDVDIRIVADKIVGLVSNVHGA